MNGMRVFRLTGRRDSDGPDDDVMDHCVFVGDYHDDDKPLDEDDPQAAEVALLESGAHALIEPLAMAASRR